MGILGTIMLPVTDGRDRVWELCPSLATEPSLSRSPAPQHGPVSTSRNLLPPQMSVCCERLEITLSPGLDMSLWIPWSPAPVTEVPAEQTGFRFSKVPEREKPTFLLQ